MRKLALAMALLLLFCGIADAKIIGNFSNDATGLKTVTLDEALVKDNSSENTSSNTIITQSVNSSNQQPVMKSETAGNDDFIRNEVSAGFKLFVRSMVNDVYSNFNNSVYNALVFVPNPYQDKGVVQLYGGYLNISIYMIVLFIFGALINRSLARTKLTFRKTDLSHSAFIGGIAICCFAIVANIIYAGALDLIEALNQFITLPVMPEIANPDNLLLFLIKGLCDLVLLGFFVIRYYVIYLFAVVCSMVAVLLVPEFTRDFAKDCIEKITRILFLQPAALFVYVVCLIASEGLPDILKSFSYIGMTVLVAATCWYFLFGNFTLLKKGVSFAITKGVVKI